MRLPKDLPSIVVFVVIAVCCGALGFVINLSLSGVDAAFKHDASFGDKIAAVGNVIMCLSLIALIIYTRETHLVRKKAEEQAVTLMDREAPRLGAFSWKRLSGNQRLGDRECRIAEAQFTNFGELAHNIQITTDQVHIDVVKGQHIDLAQNGRADLSFVLDASRERPKDGRWFDLTVRCQDVFGRTQVFQVHVPAFDTPGHWPVERLSGARGERDLQS